MARVMMISFYSFFNSNAAVPLIFIEKGLFDEN